MKENFFSPKMALKSDEELKAIINNKQDYQKEALMAAMWELEKRGKGEATEPIKAEIWQKAQLEEKQYRQENNYTDDPNAPELYPKWSIWFLGIFFAPVFAGIMLAMNLQRLEKRKYLFLSIALGIVPFIILASLPVQSKGFTYLINGAATITMVEVIWNREIGELKYRKRSAFIPILISILITVLIVVIIFESLIFGFH